MRVITLLNQCYHFPGFVYGKARVRPEDKSIEIDIRPRRGNKPLCSGCHRPGPGYDHLGVRHFEFVPLWGFLVYFAYCMRRVDCKTCGVRVEEIPWATGKHQLTKAYKSSQSFTGPPPQS
jgi:transposase